MNFKYKSLMIAIAAAFAAQGVMAQDAASAPKTRAEVKAETKAAVKAGDIPKEADAQGLPKPSSTKSATPRKSLREARAKERAEVKKDLKAGAVPKAEVQDAPKPAASTTTRAEVKAETKRAVKAGEVPQGEVPDVKKK